MIDDFSLIADQYSRIPETADTRFRPLVEPYMSPDVFLRTSLLQRADLRSVDMQALRGEAMEEGVVIDWSREGCPEWVSIEHRSDVSDPLVVVSGRFGFTLECEFLGRPRRLPSWRLLRG
jgi:hypothetical protein